MTDMFRIGIVGAGYMASEHARAFASFPNAIIAGVVSRSPERAEALGAAHCCPVFPDIAALRADGGADAVVVAVPELACRSVCEEVFRHEWVSLLEKPVGLNLGEAREILAAAEKADHEAYVALNRRAYSSTRTALALLDEDEPRLIVVNDTQDLREAREFGQPEPVLKNWMFANSIHLVDYLHVFGRGEVDSVTITMPWNHAKPSSVTATVHFDSGDIGLYTAVWNAPGPWSVAVTNRKIRAELRPLEQLGVQRLGERRLTPVPADPNDSIFKPGLHHQARSLLDRLGGGVSDLPSLADATRSMELVARIYQRDE